VHEVTTTAQFHEHFSRIVFIDRLAKDHTVDINSGVSPDHNFVRSG